MKVALAAAAVLGLSLTATPTVTAQTHALALHVIVTPATDLPATAQVTVTIRGFEPEEAVFLQ
ncbi:hypothetical protein [Streptomyces sp. NPDC059957]|uniref:hypothetical protein n=1 Tax=unclassified Streptomyces TaxID=2593676 RepID=UPI00365C82C3